MSPVTLKPGSCGSEQPFLSRLFDPGVPFGNGPASARNLPERAAPEVTGMAVDVLIELIRDGRCVGAELGRVLGMLPHTVIKLNRLGKHLDTVARASLLHVHVLKSCSKRVPHSKYCPRTRTASLAPCWNGCQRLSSACDECRPLLEKAKSGSTGTLARKLLQLVSRRQSKQRSWRKHYAVLATGPAVGVRRSCHVTNGCPVNEKGSLSSADKEPDRSGRADSNRRPPAPKAGGRAYRTTGKTGKRQGPVHPLHHRLHQRSENGANRPRGDDRRSAPGTVRRRSARLAAILASPSPNPGENTAGREGRT